MITFIRAEAVELIPIVVPIYQSEITAPAIRGRLVALQQWSITWGILIMYFIEFGCSYLDGNASFRIPWGLQMVPAVLLSVGMLFFPESPRWLIKQGRYDAAYESIRRLRRSSLQAARDLYYIHVLLEAEVEIQTGRNLFVELFTVPRNRRATLASSIVMFMQQFCGVNACVEHQCRYHT